MSPWPYEILVAELPWYDHWAMKVAAAILCVAIAVMALEVAFHPRTWRCLSRFARWVWRKSHIHWYRSPCNASVRIRNGYGSVLSHFHGTSRQCRCGAVLCLPEEPV